MDASAYVGWTPEQIKALLDGIGKVIAADVGAASDPETAPQ
jgi:hypothetical protein